MDLSSWYWNDIYHFLAKTSAGIAMCHMNGVFHIFLCSCPVSRHVSTISRVSKFSPTIRIATFSIVGVLNVHSCVQAGHLSAQITTLCHRLCSNTVLNSLANVLCSQSNCCRSWRIALFIAGLISSHWLSCSFILPIKYIW